MSLVHVYVGQAGNQIGSACARYVGPPSGGPATVAAGRASRQQPGVAFIDSEPKVVRPLRVVGEPEFLPFATAESVVFDQNGRGNNWAWGYSGVASHRAPVREEAGGVIAGRTAPLLDRALDAIRAQAEALDGGLGGLLIVHSLGGGTGSGLGSRLLEALRDDYASSTLLSACVAPFVSGDTPLQYYNMALTLATANECADAVLLFDNDDAMARVLALRRQAEAVAAGAAGGGSVAAARARIRAERAGGSSADEFRVTTTEINDVIAQSLAGVVLPSVHREAWSGDLRDPSGGLRRRGRGGAVGERDIGPGWQDVRAPEEPAFGGLLSEADSGGGRAAWLAEEHDRAVREAAAPGGSGAGVATPFNARAWVADLCPAGPALKYVDVRSALPVMLPPPGRAAAARRGPPPPSASALSWIDLSESLCELLPRFDRRGSPVLTLAARLTARGAPRSECDSVDPSLEAEAAGAAAAAAAPQATRPATSSGRPSQPHLPPPVGVPRSVVELWPGLPQTAEWEQASMRLNRALHRGVLAPPRASTGGGGVRGGTGAGTAPAGRYTARDASVGRLGGASLPPLPPWPRSALLSPGPVYRSSIAPVPQPRTLTLASNSTWATPTLEHCAARAAALLEAKAYVHWYERFGVTAEHLAVAVESVRTTADAYRSLQRAPG